jgi:hypothetical protein
MGTYCYTARSETKNVAGLLLGHYEYSYKPWWGCENSPVVLRKLAAADRAAEKLNARGVKYFAEGHFTDVNRYGYLRVYHREHGACSSYYDGCGFPGEHVFDLVKRGSRYALVPAGEGEMPPAEVGGDIVAVGCS